MTTRTTAVSRAAVLALVPALFFSTAAHAQTAALPDVKDVPQAALLQEADAEYQRYVAAPDSYFKFDEAKSQWPCKISAKKLKVLAGATGYQSSGAGKPDVGHAFSNVVIHPVSAACKDGKLDGQVVFVYEATRKAWGPGYENTSQELGRVTATMVKGKLTHKLEVRKSTDVAGGKPSSIATSAETPAGAFITSATILAAHDGRKYFLKRPAADKRLEKTFYAGTTLVSVEQQDAKGRPDGAAVSYKDGQETRSCFKHGKPADAAQCAN